MDLPQAVQALIGVARYEQEADNEVSLANIRAMCAAVENSNPRYWGSQEVRPARESRRTNQGWRRPPPGFGNPDGDDRQVCTIPP